MRSALKLLAAFGFWACSSDMTTAAPEPLGPPPPIPSPTQPPPAGSWGVVWVWGFVVEESGACIDGAVLRVIRGQGLGRTENQVTPCGAWDYGNGFLFDSLTLGVPMTIRITAPGYVTQDTTITPTPATRESIFLVHAIRE